MVFTVYLIFNTTCSVIDVACSVLPRALAHRHHQRTQIHTVVRPKVVVRHCLRAFIDSKLAAYQTPQRQVPTDSEGASCSGWRLTSHQVLLCPLRYYCPFSKPVRNHCRHSSVYTFLVVGRGLRNSDLGYASVTNCVIRDLPLKPRSDLQ